jgi:hypothetical protein
MQLGIHFTNVGFSTTPCRLDHNAMEMQQKRMLVRNTLEARGFKSHPVRLRKKRTGVLTDLVAAVVHANDFMVRSPL